MSLSEEQSERRRRLKLSNGEESDEGARRWRGRRRRRGGRRGGRGFERDARTESAPAPNRTPRSSRSQRPASSERTSRGAQRIPSRNRDDSARAHESRPRQDYGPPAGYTPIILPGESISKYRNLPACGAGSTERRRNRHDDAASMPVEDFTAPAAIRAKPRSKKNPGRSIAPRSGLRGSRAGSACRRDAPGRSRPRSRAGRRRKTGAWPSCRWGWRNRKAAEAEKAETGAAGSCCAPRLRAKRRTVSLPPRTLSTSSMTRRKLPPVPSSRTKQPSKSSVTVESAELASYVTSSRTPKPRHDTNIATQPKSTRSIRQPATLNCLSQERHAAPNIAPEGRTLEHEVWKTKRWTSIPFPTI